MSSKLTDRLYFKQAQNALLVAFILGLLVSVVQLVYDLSSEQQRIDETIEQVLNTTRETASQAAYGLNNDLADRVIHGLFEYRPIYFAQISDDFGRALATLERPLVEHDLHWLGWLVGQQNNEYSIPLYITDAPEGIGSMQVRVDRFLVAQDFLNRAGLIILGGFIRNVILAVFFGIMFYFTLGLPIMRVIASLSKVDPTQPHKSLVELPKGHENDELGDLIKKINNLLMDFTDTLYQRLLTEEELKRNQETIRQLNMRLEERVRQRTSELESANKEMEAFTYSVSHDLRAPLRTVSGFGKILQDEYGEDLDEQGAHYLRRVLSGTAKMEDLINDLLKLSRSTRGDMRLSDFNLSELVSEVIEEYRQRHPEREVKTYVAPDEYVYGDRRFMRVLLDNLIGNAWKYTGKTDKPEIRFERMEKEQQVIHMIRDNGAGFDMNYADKMFAPFQRLHSSKEFEGTGVGLATVQRVINRHGGDVWAEGEVGKGACFYFTLPRPIIELIDD